MVSRTPIEIMRPKAQALAQVLSTRLGPHGFDLAGTPWAGYAYGAELEGAMVGEGFGDALAVKFWRRGRPEAHIILAFLGLVDIHELDRSPAAVLESNIVDTHSWDIEIAEGTTYDETLSHTFKSVQSQASAFKQAWEVSAKANIGYSGGGFSAGLEIAAKYGQSYEQSVSSGTEDSDTVSRHFTFTGPKKSQVSAIRRRNRESRTVTVIPATDFKTYFWPGGWQFDDFATTFMAQLEGQEPEHTDYTPFGGNSSIREVMQRLPLTGAERALLIRNPHESFTVDYVYDNVMSQGIYEHG